MKNNNSNFIKSNRGASLVLVSIFSTLVIGMSVTLIIVSSMLLSQSGRKTRSDQAYELATSFSSKLEYMILNELDDAHPSMIELTDGLTISSGSGFEGIPDSKVSAVVKEVRDTDNNILYYSLTVTGEAAGERYVIVNEYTGNAIKGYSRR